MTESMIGLMSKNTFNDSFCFILNNIITRRRTKSIMNTAKFLIKIDPFCARNKFTNIIGINGINKRIFFGLDLLVTRLLFLDLLVTRLLFLKKYIPRGNRKYNKGPPEKLFSELIVNEVARIEANKETGIFFV